MENALRVHVRCEECVCPRLKKTSPLNLVRTIAKKRPPSTHSVQTVISPTIVTYTLRVQVGGCARDTCMSVVCHVSDYLQQPPSPFFHCVDKSSAPKHNGDDRSGTAGVPSSLCVPPRPPPVPPPVPPCPFAHLTHAPFVTQLCLRTLQQL